MQNAAFAARGLDWAYVALRVEAAGLEAGVRGLVALGFAGANVTAPHKVAAVAFCDELDEAAERAGSVNTLVVRDGRVLGASTDGLAVTGAVPVAGRSVAVLGAGGAAQAVATALLAADARSLTIAARRLDAARALAARLRTVFPGRAIAAGDAPDAGHEADVVVNATPVRDSLPAEPRAGQTVVDLAYRPDARATALVAAARERGCETIEGLEVLARQGAAAFERWTGMPAPLDVMRASLRSAP